MSIKEILQFIKETFENSLIALVKSIKSHIFTVKLDSNKVEIVNPFKLPKVVLTKEVNPINNKADIEKQTKELIVVLTKQINKINETLLKLAPKSKVEVSNLKDIPKPAETVRILNPQKSVSVTNFYEIQKELGKLKKAIESLKLDPKIVIPEIKVPPVYVPEIKQPPIKNEIVLDKLEKLISKDPKKYVPVRLSDGEKFYEALKEIEQVVSSSGGGRYAFQDTAGERTYGLVNLLRQLMVVSEERWGVNDTEKIGNTIYSGEEDVDGNWIVRKQVKTTGKTNITYATIKNNPTINNYQSAWEDKTELTFSSFSIAFALK